MIVKTNVILLILCVFFWVASFFRSEICTIKIGDPVKIEKDEYKTVQYTISTGKGHIEISVWHEYEFLPDPLELKSRHYGYATFSIVSSHYRPEDSYLVFTLSWSRYWHFAGFAYRHVPKYEAKLVDVETWYFIMPFWALTLLFALYPTIFYSRKFRFARRKKRGLCIHCGYDLRASPDRCPECGVARHQRNQVA